MTEHDGRHRADPEDRAARASASADPLHRLPLVGRFMRGADEMRHRIPLIGEHLTRTDADVLRFEARMLRMVASRIEGRAQELDRIARREEGATVKKIQIE